MAPKNIPHPGQMETFLPSLLGAAEGGSTVVLSLAPDLGWALWFVCGLGGCFCFLNNL